MKYTKQKIKIIAEAGVNHNGKISTAYKLIDKAKKANVDAIKFQIYKTDQLITKRTKLADYQKANIKKNTSQYEMAKNLELSFNQHINLKKYCKKKKIMYLCSAFDIPSLKFLKKINLKIFKIPSGEITNYPYLKTVGSFNKEVIMSTGMATIQEIKEAIRVLLKTRLKKNKITLLHCHTDYPTNYKDVNLNAMRALSKKFGVNVGLSDHTLGIEVPIAAAALGAKVIEKHFTLDRKLSGPDHKASLIPSELSQMVKLIRNVEVSLGVQKKIVSKKELKILKVARKSIVAIRSIKKGEKLTEKNLGIKRPGVGISPMKWLRIIGKKSNKNYNTDELIKY